MADLSPFSLPGRFWRGNLHTHSTLSDGVLSPEQVVDAYKNAGYDFMMLSDHFLDRFNWPVSDTRKLRSNNFTTIIGSELHAPHTSVGELWHIVAAGLPLDFAPCEPDETGEQLARRAAALGAFIGIAHPAWSQLTIEDGRAMDVAHAVEIYNHGRRLTAFATDDAHFASDDHFGGWVHVRAESLEPETILEALKSGHYYSSQGPLIHELSLSGSELTVASSPVDTIVVVCGNSRTVHRAGKSIVEATLNLEKLKQSWLPLKQDSPWFRVALIDHAGKRAWTNPIWWDSL